MTAHQLTLLFFIICNFSRTDASCSASKQADICLLYGISFENAWCYRKSHNFLKRTWTSVHNVTDCKEDPDQNHRCSKHNLIWQMLMRNKKNMGLEILQTWPLTARHSVVSLFGLSWWQCRIKRIRPRSHRLKDLSVTIWQPPGHGGIMSLPWPIASGCWRLMAIAGKIIVKAAATHA